MNLGLFHGVSAMTASERRLEAISHNLANLGTPAYKRASTATFASASKYGERGGPLTTIHNRVDFSQGLLDRTENPYDLALMGEGYFAVEGANGPMYTRNGSFRVDDQGVLQTVEGFMVAWQGATGRIDPVGEPVTINPKGLVEQGTRRVGQLSLVNFDNQSQLRLGKDGYWHADAALEPKPTEAEVHQGALERSNVNAVDELVQLIAVQRAFDSAASLITMIDQSYRRLNNEN